MSPHDVCFCQSSGRPQPSTFLEQPATLTETSKEERLNSETLCRGHPSDGAPHSRKHAPHVVQNTQRELESLKGLARVFNSWHSRTRRRSGLPNLQLRRQKKRRRPARSTLFSSGYGYCIGIIKMSLRVKATPVTCAEAQHAEFMVQALTCASKPVFLHPKIIIP